MRTRRLAAAALLLAAGACREPSDPSIPLGRIERVRADAQRSLLLLLPDEARAGEVFQRQPDGRAGLSVVGTGLSHGDVVHWGGRPLDTTFGNSRLLTALVPRELVQRPGEVEVTVENASDPTRRKLRAIFRLRPRA